MTSSVSLFPRSVFDIHTACRLISKLSGPSGLTRYLGLQAEPHNCPNKADKRAIDPVEQSLGYAVARVRYATALPHLLLFIIFLISHVYYICYFLLSMYGHQGNAGTLSHVIFCQLPKTVISFYIQSCPRTRSCIKQTAFIPML